MRGDIDIMGGDLHVTLIDCAINWMYCYCC